MITGLALRFVVGLTFLGAGTFEDQRRVAETNLLGIGDLAVFDEAILDEVLFAFLFLLGFEIRRVGGVTTLAVAVMTFDVIVIFGFFDHDDLVDTTFTGGGDGADVQDGVTSGALAGSPRSQSVGRFVSVMVFFIVMMMIFVSGVASVSTF